MDKSLTINILHMFVIEKMSQGETTMCLILGRLAERLSYWQNTSSNREFLSD